MTTGPPPPLLRCEVDGGTENWNKTFFTFMGYLVGTGVYTNTHVIRLPRWHTENDCEQSMQAMSVLSQGMGPGLETDSEESETDEEPSEHALEYVRVHFDVTHWEVDGVLVILSVGRRRVCSGKYTT